MTLSVRGVARRFGTVDAVRDVSLELVAGEWVALVGPSGCGKTTLLQILGLLDRPTRGTVVLDGHDAWARSSSWRARARLGRIGFVFQDHNLLDHLSARENIAAPAWWRGGSRSRALAAADALLDRLGLAACAERPAHALSGGEAQRVAIARSIVNAPAVVLADEPTGSLDSAASATVLAALDEIVATGAALLVVTHDDAVARRAARVVSMRDGAIA